MLEKLPLGKAHMMSFELIPIGPLNPLRLLQGMQPKPSVPQDGGIAGFSRDQRGSLMRDSTPRSQHPGWRSPPLCVGNGSNQRSRLKDSG
jgi:hypothetical protein